MLSWASKLAMLKGAVLKGPEADEDMTRKVAQTTDLGIAERLLLLFCNDPKPVPMVHYDEGTALNELTSIFNDLSQKIRGRRVVDFGCGLGYQVVALAEAGASFVTGIEHNAALASQAQARLEQHGLGDRAHIRPDLGDEKADIIISQNSFEHFEKPDAILELWKRALAPGGTIYVTFGPLWFSPTGSHMGFFCSLPWANLLFSERVVISARSRYRDDGASNYTEAGLGKMSLAKFERVVKDSGLSVQWRRYDCVRRANFLHHVSVVRELFVNRVSCILTA